MDLLYSLAESFTRFMDASPGLLGFPFGFIIAGIPVVLLHELGHALAAIRLLGGDVEVSVGSVGKIADTRLGGIAVSLNAVSNPIGTSGSAEFDASRATARDVLLIALAGPAASFVGTVLTASLFVGASAGVLRDFLWAATFVGALGVLNLIPFTLKERRNGPSMRSDGRLALDALRVVRALQ